MQASNPCHASLYLGDGGHGGLASRRGLRSPIIHVTFLRAGLASIPTTLLVLAPVLFVSKRICTGLHLHTHRISTHTQSDVRLLTIRDCSINLLSYAHTVGSPNVAVPAPPARLPLTNFES